MPVPYSMPLRECRVATNDMNIGTYSKLRLVFVHAENDGTMPWNQTEELVASTVKAATEPNAEDDASTASTPKYEVVDLGEAGTQEIWETGTARIEKLIAKHGGEQTPPITKKSKKSACSWRSSALRDRIRPSSISPAINLGPRPTLQRISDFALASFAMLQTVPSPLLVWMKTKEAGVRQRHRHRLLEGSKRTSTMTSLAARPARPLTALG